MYIKLYFQLNSARKWLRSTVSVMKDKIPVAFLISSELKRHFDYTVRGF